MLQIDAPPVENFCLRHCTALNSKKFEFFSGNDTDNGKAACRFLLTFSSLLTTVLPCLIFETGLLMTFYATSGAIIIASHANTVGSTFSMGSY